MAVIKNRIKNIFSPLAIRKTEKMGFLSVSFV